MLRSIIRLALVALVVHAAVKTIPVFWTQLKFKDAVEEMAMFAGKRTDQEVAERVMQIANRLDVPLAREDLTVRRAQRTTYVDAAYTTRLEVFPRKFYPWTFEVHIQAVPPRYSDMLP